MRGKNNKFHQVSDSSRLCRLLRIKIAAGGKMRKNFFKIWTEKIEVKKKKKSCYPFSFDKLKWQVFNQLITLFLICYKSSWQTVAIPTALINLINTRLKKLENCLLRSFNQLSSHLKCLSIRILFVNQVSLEVSERFFFWQYSSIRRWKVVWKFKTFVRMKA